MSKSAATRKTKGATSKAVSVVTPKKRKLKQSTYKSFKLSKRIKHPAKLLSAWMLTKQSAQLLWDNKRLLAGITLVYGFLNVILAQGLGGTDITELKDQLGEIFTGNFGSLASSLIIFTTLVGSAGNSSSDIAGAYQLFLALIASLAIIWALRQILAGSTIRVRDAFYRGMYPLIPFILVMLVIGLQLIPLAIGSTLYSLVISNGIAVFAIEKVLWGLLFALLALLSLYMIASSIFALYIVTLPDMTPMKALRSARELVRYRRWTVLRKILFLPLVLLVVAAIVMVPIIIWVSPLATYVFFVLTMTGLVAAHSYMYLLYRELLND